jgi:hypothetical protein
MFEGTVLFPNQDDARVEIAWNDAKRKQSPAWVRILGQRSRWRLPNGILLGDGLLGVERRNGFPFPFIEFLRRRPGYRSLLGQRSHPERGYRTLPHQNLVPTKLGQMI